jgi:hypothetical protein
MPRFIIPEDGTRQNWRMNAYYARAAKKQMIISKTEKSQSRRKRTFLSIFCQICLIIQVLIFFGSCTQEPGKKRDVSLKKELEIGLAEGDENYIFGLVADVKIDSLGNVYVLDVRMNRIVKYDRAGKFILGFGKKGVGPGEFENPRTIALNSSGKVYVLDFRKVIVFDENGGFIKSFGLDFMGVDLAINDQGNLVILGARSDQLFNVYDSAGDYLHSFGNLVDIPEEFSKFKDAGLFRTPLRVWTNRNKIFVMNPYKYEICFYENESLKGKLVRRSSDYIKPEFKEEIPGGFSAAVANNFILEKNNTIYVYYDGKKASWLDIFEYGKLIKSMEVKGTLAAIDDEGRFYFIENEDYPKIVRYSENIKH